MPISTGDFAKFMAPQNPKLFDQGMSRFEKTYPELFETLPMDEPVKEMVNMSGLGLWAQTSEGEANPYDDFRQLFVARFMPADFRLGVIITQNLIDDGKAVEVTQRAMKNLGISYKETIEILCHNVINRAQTSGYNGMDGVTLINSAHPMGFGYTNSNIPSASTDFSESAVEQMHIDLGAWVDSRGLKLNAWARKLVLPRAQTFEAQRILGSPLRSTDASNATNAIKDLNMFPEGVIIDNYITNATAWYVITNMNEDGLKLFERKAVGFSNDRHFDTDNYKIKGHSRLCPGYVNPLCIYGNVGP